MQEIRLLKRLLVILLVLILVYVLLLTFEIDNNEKAITEQVVPICDIHVSDIRALAVKNNNGAFGLLVGQGGISLEPNKEGARYSLDEMQGYIYIISKMSSMRVIDKIESLADFGFDAPESKLTIIKSDGSKLRFLLGKESDSSGSHYLMQEGGEKIFVVPSNIVKLFLRSKKEFAQRDIIPRLGVDDLERLSKVSIWSKTRASREYTVENRGGYNFILTSPIENSLSAERFFTDIILPLTTLYPDGVVSVDPLLFDSANIDYICKVTIDGKEYRILFIRKNNEMYYVKDESKDVVYEIPAERVSFLSNDYLELLSGALYSCNVGRIDSIMFDDIMNNQSNTLYISGSGNEVRAEISGRVIGYKQLMEFVNLLNSFSMSEEVLGESVLPVPEPYYTITVNKKDGGRDYIEFVKGSGSQSYLRVNGVINFMVYDKLVDSVKNGVKGFLKNKE